jgi:hypothetical protein
MSDSKKQDPREQYGDWKQRYAAGDQSAKELFEQISHIALMLSYDMIDKLRYWENETVKLSDEEVDKRIPHMSNFLEKLQTAYDTFADVDM